MRLIGTEAGMDEGTRLWTPPLALAGCVRGAMLRDTRGRELTACERESYFPAAPLMSLCWWFEGSGQWLARAGFSEPSSCLNMLPLMLMGPFTRPTHIRSDGAEHTLRLLFPPDVFKALTGVNPGALVNTVVNAHDWLPPDWLTLGHALLCLPDDDARLAAIEAFLLPRWQTQAPVRSVGQRYTDWAEALAMRAALSATGRSLRQVERRVKSWAGLPMRELQAISRAERAFLAAVAIQVDVAKQANAGVSWAGIAAETDYADQSHLCRETRRFTGFSPEDLRLRVLSEEAFWAYRLWR